MIDRKHPFIFKVKWRDLYFVGLEVCFNMDYQSRTYKSKEIHRNMECRIWKSIGIRKIWNRNRSCI